MGRFRGNLSENMYFISERLVGDLRGLAINHIGGTYKVTNMGQIKKR